MEIVKTDKINFSIGGVNDYPDVNPTDGEAKIFGYIKRLCPSAEFVRKSAEYVTACYNDIDIARFKFTDRAKWVLFPYMDNNKKRRIEKPEDLAEFEEDIIKSYEFAVKLP